MALAGVIRLAPCVHDATGNHKDRTAGATRVNPLTWVAPLRTGKPVREADVTRHLDQLEEKARHAPFGMDAYIWNEAGDLCVAVDREFDARRYFGRAIDTFLDAGRFDIAHAIARKMLRHYPDVVRARCTLAWIAIGRGIRPEISHALTSYAGAARDCGMDRPLVRELNWMADIVDNRETLLEIGEWLLDTGASREANRVFGRAFFRPEPTVTADSPWAYIVDYAKRDAWLNDAGRKVGEHLEPLPEDHEPILLPLDYVDP